MFTFGEFKNFFKYYAEEEHQDKALSVLYNSMPKHLLMADASWVETYRQKPKSEEQTNEAIPWPLSKDELAQIMGCSKESLPDSLMDDLAVCVSLYNMNTLSLAYFLGQCGHESAGLRYPVEIHSGTDYEWRHDLGNIYPGDGVKYAGTGWIQVTGRYNHQRFSDYLDEQGKSDYKIMEEGKRYTSEKYPWSISGFWWNDNGMNEYCQGYPDTDAVGARVNGKYLPNGYLDRREYTNRAFKVLHVD